MPLAGLTVGFINQQLSVQPAVGSRQAEPVTGSLVSTVHCPLCPQLTLNQTRCPFMRLSLGPRLWTMRSIRGKPGGVGAGSGFGAPCCCSFLLACNFLWPLFVFI